MTNRAHKLRNNLAERLEVFQRATIASLERELLILHKRVEVARAQDLVAKVDLGRRQDLESRGIFNRKMVESAQAAGAATVGEVEVNNLTVELLQHGREPCPLQQTFAGQTGAAECGKFDVPSSGQKCAKLADPTFTATIDFE